MLRTTTAALLVLAAPSLALAEEKRGLDAHAHGVSTLGVAIEGGKVQIELRAPGADVVGFEYAPKSAKEKSAVEKAEAELSKPLTLLGVPAAAKCKVVEAKAHFEVEGADEHDHEHDEHKHDDHAEHKDDHKHDDHAEHKDDHKHDDHAEHKDGDKHDDHAEHKDGDKHDDHEHDEKAEGASHAEFEAEYTLSCASPEALDALALAWFERFANAEKVEAIVIRDGAQFAHVATKASPTVPLKASK
ncbi:MAG: DUF2796 domain-containing protein [Neomegalonema sp.]|nr:DUF2796 domain-containing protein [Neomegalonema sp.]